MKLNSNGSQLVYATYLGGNRDEHPHSLNTNSRNELVVMGTTAAPTSQGHQRPTIPLSMAATTCF